MADFSVQSTVKSAVRTLATPIESVASFNSIVDDLISGNPWGCTGYTSGGVSHGGVEQSSASFKATIAYENDESKKVGSIPVTCRSSTGLATIVASILANAAIDTAMGATTHSRDQSADTYSRTIKGHWSNGEVFSVTFTRERVTVSGYEDAAILTAVETWADTIPALA